MDTVKICPSCLVKWYPSVPTSCLSVALVIVVSAEGEMLKLSLETQISTMQRRCSPNHGTFVTLTVLSLKYKSLWGLKWNFYFCFPCYRCLNLEIILIFIYNCNFLICLLEKQRDLLSWKCFAMLLCSMFLTLLCRTIVVKVSKLPAGGTSSTVSYGRA